MPDWRAGQLSGYDDYEIHDELYASDGRCVAVLECFTSNLAVYYCNAITPDGERVRIGAGCDYHRTKQWAEKVSGLSAGKPSRHIKN